MQDRLRKVGLRLLINDTAIGVYEYSRVSKQQEKASGIPRWKEVRFGLTLNFSEFTVCRCLEHCDWKA